MLLRVSYELMLLGCPADRLSDHALMTRFLETLPFHIGMDIASEPLVVEISSDETTRVGLSGSIIIKQSHVNCHAWPESERLDVTISSCRSFDAARATDFAAVFFAARSSDTTYTERMAKTIMPTPSL